MSQQFRECVRQMIIKLKFLPKRTKKTNNSDIKKLTRSYADSLQIDAATRRNSQKENYSSKSNGSFAPIIFKQQNHNDEVSRSISSNTLLAVSDKKGSLNTFYCINDGAYCININKAKDETLKDNKIFNDNTNQLVNDSEFYANGLTTIKNCILQTTHINDSGCGNDSEIEEDEYDKYT